MGRIKFTHTYEHIISPENLLVAWKEFQRGKRGRKDVQEFELRLMENILSLHRDLKEKTYTHSNYKAFNISDSKPRSIHKADVRDRLLHHAIHRKLYPFFDTTFIHDSYSCRNNKGTHRALNRFRTYARKASQNHTKTLWVLKCDIRKFFASIDQAVLKKILTLYILDKDVLWLLSRVIESFSSSYGTLFEKKGLPLGNLTSQLFVNIYMNEFDQYVKHRLKARYYIRYADDFVFLSEDKEWLSSLLPQASLFLQERLMLNLHPKKVSLETLASGVDFLGWVHFPHHRVLRTTTKRRMLKALKENPSEATLQSYRGLLSHGNAYTLERQVKQCFLELACKQVAPTEHCCLQTNRFALG